MPTANLLARTAERSFHLAARSSVAAYHRTGMHKQVLSHAAVKGLAALRREMARLSRGRRDLINGSLSHLIYDYRSAARIIGSICGFLFYISLIVSSDSSLVNRLNAAILLPLPKFERCASIDDRSSGSRSDERSQI